MVDAAAVVAAAAGADTEQEAPAAEQQRLLGASGGAGGSGTRLTAERRGQQQGEAKPSRAARMGWRERLQRTAALWPYMGPLMLGGGAWRQGLSRGKAAACTAC